MHTSGIGTYHMASPLDQSTVSHSLESIQNVIKQPQAHDGWSNLMSEFSLDKYFRKHIVEHNYYIQDAAFEVLWESGWFLLCKYTGAFHLNQIPKRTPPFVHCPGPDVPLDLLVRRDLCPGSPDSCPFDLEQWQSGLAASGLESLMQISHSGTYLSEYKHRCKIIKANRLVNWWIHNVDMVNITSINKNLLLVLITDNKIPNSDCYSSW